MTNTHHQSKLYQALLLMQRAAAVVVAKGDPILEEQKKLLNVRTLSCKEDTVLDECSKETPQCTYTLL